MSRSPYFATWFRRLLSRDITRRNGKTIRARQKKLDTAARAASQPDAGMICNPPAHAEDKAQFLSIWRFMGFRSPPHLPISRV
jgi:hypothetical protein